MSTLRSGAVCVVIVLIFMLTLNIDLMKEKGSKYSIQKELFRKRRAVGQKPRMVFGICGGTHYGRQGWIATPNFPGSSYPALSKCNWTITVYPRMVIRFDFVYMDMEDAPIQKTGGCQADYLIIREGQNEDDELVGGQRYCGFDTPFNSVYSKSNRVYVYFAADKDVEGQGFAVRWVAVEPPKAQFDCDFEKVKGLCIGWKQDKNASFDWTTHNGQTQSGKTTATGPLTDHTKKTEKVEYVMESQDVRHKWFYPATKYHMRGETMGTLNVYRREIISETNTTSELLFTKSGDQGKPWRRADLNVTSSVNRVLFAFEGVRGSSYKSDMAIDDIQLLKKPCPAPRVVTTTTEATTTRRIIPTRRPRRTRPIRRTRAPITTPTIRTTRKSLRITTTPFTTTTPADCFYRCKEGNNCIQEDYFCDGVNDCLHREDEKDCSDTTPATSSETPTSSWTDWTAWSTCSLTCDGGRSERERTCKQGGLFACIGSTSQGIECNTRNCLSWNEWEEWGSCTKKCGGGIRTRARICNGGMSGKPGCIGPVVEVDFCNEHNCPRWGEWSRWSDCQATCGNGTISRTRPCEGAGQADDQECDGLATEYSTCTNPSVPSCGDWTQWSEFSECTRTCGGGTRSRSRQCRKDGVPTQGCPGIPTNEDNCNTLACPSWTDWSEYGECSVTCGSGSRTKQRQCLQSETESQACPGNSTMKEDCKLPPCIEWSDWAPWSVCSATCDGGFHGRRRYCMQGSERARSCPGSGIERGRCNEQSCPTLIIYLTDYCCCASSWSNWTGCSVTCGEGKRTRRRPCEAFELGCDEGTFVKQLKDCALPPCGGLSCYDGISATVDGFETINTFNVRKCEEIPHVPASKDPNGRTGLFCATTIMTVRRGDVKVDMIQGTCLNEDLCNEISCDRYKTMMGLHNIESCEVRCCGRDRCNNPNNYKQKRDNSTDDSKKDPCSSNPCQNSGSCIATKGKDGAVDYTCACRPGFNGRNCTEAATKICHTGISTRSAVVPVATPMLITACNSPDDQCLVATVASYVNYIPLYVDTAQCVTADVCKRLKCADLKKTIPSYKITSCKIQCCDSDFCNTAPSQMPPLPTTTPYTAGTLRTTTRRRTAKPKPSRKPTRKPTRRPQTRKTTIMTTTSTTTTTESTTVDTSGPHWSNWRDWQSCTHQCGNDGTKRRYRYCMKGAPGMPGCLPQNGDQQIEPCNTGISCIRWREWGHWQSCSRSCGGGNRERRRTCDGGAPNTGDCIGSDIEQEKCSEQSCDTTTTTTTTTVATTTTTVATTTPGKPASKSPRWDNWSNWDTCSTTCGAGTQKRSRKCIGGRPGRRGCKGRGKQSQKCSIEPCTTTTTTTATTTTKKVRGWGAWSDWSPCSVSCGQGSTSRSRQCEGGRPGQKGCKGKRKESNNCGTPCPETPDAPAAKCLERNGGLARKNGRRCPSKCSSNSNCKGVKKCVCDGFCGKTCQDPSKACINILAADRVGTIVTCSNGNSVGSVCTFTCEKGYELDGNDVVICQGTSKWTNQNNIPQCTTLAAPSTSKPPPACSFKNKNHNSCCGDKSYNSATGKCCSGKVSPGGPAMTECCGNRPYAPKKRGCCKGKSFRLSDQKCQRGRIVKK